jgi:hypothetical protein
MTVTGKFKGYTAERLAPAVEAIYADLP